MDTRFLDVAIGLVLVFALTSLLASIITEAIRNYTGARGQNLKTAIASMLGDDQKLADDFYALPIIRTLYLDERHPSYMEAGLFSTGFFELLRTQLSPALGRGQGTPQEYINALSATLKTHPTPGLATVVETLQSLSAGVGNDWPAFEARITDWFNATGDRSIGWFTRSTQRILLLVGFVLAAALNINAIVIANTLWNDPVMRDAVARQAEAIVAERNGQAPATAADAAPGAARPNSAGGADKPAITLEQAGKLTDQQLNELIKALQHDRTTSKFATTLMEQASILRQELGYARAIQAIKGVDTASVSAMQKPVDDQLQALRKLGESDSAKRLDPSVLTIANRRIEGLAQSIAIERKLAEATLSPPPITKPQKPPGTCPRLPATMPTNVLKRADTGGADAKAANAAGADNAPEAEATWALGKLCALGIPIGWGDQALATVYPGHPVQEFFMVTLWGWLITAAACTLGAQFWFDLLGKLVKLRAAGRAPPSGAAAEGDTKPATAPTMAGQPAPGSAPTPFQYALNEVERGLSESQIRRLQQFIRMPSGKISGLLDGPTREAIVQWHRDRGQGDSNELTAADVSQLLQDQAASATQPTDPAPATGPGASTPQASAQPLGQAHNTDEDACGCDLPVVNPTLDEHLPGTRGGEQ